MRRATSISVRGFLAKSCAKRESLQAAFPTRLAAQSPKIILATPRIAAAIHRMALGLEYMGAAKSAIQHVCKSQRQVPTFNWPSSRGSASEKWAGCVNQPIGIGPRLPGTKRWALEETGSPS